MEMTKQMKVRMLPTVPGTLIGTGLVFAATLATSPVLAQEIKGDAEAARQKIAMCTGCHAIEGYRASYPTVFTVPKIHGQTSKYIENALNAYRSGDRNHPTMQAIAGSLTDQDIADLAAYYGKPMEGK
jgi:cytochrome c553